MQLLAMVDEWRQPRLSNDERHHHDQNERHTPPTLPRAGRAADENRGGVPSVVSPAGDRRARAYPSSPLAGSARSWVQTSAQLRTSPPAASVLVMKFYAASS